MTEIHLRSVDAPEPFGLDGRGPMLAWWIHDADLLLPDSDEGFQPSPGGIRGAQVADGPEQMAWVLFDGLQVIQTVPEEVHAYWHTEFNANTNAGASPWRIDDSPWLETFAPRHLDDHAHFVIELYDDIVEVICRDLIFGTGAFELETVLPTEPRLGAAHLRHAQSLEKLGRVDEALAEFENYTAVATDEASAAYAQRCADAIRATRKIRPALDAGGGIDTLRQALATIGWEGVRAALWDILWDDSAAGQWRDAAAMFLEAVEAGEHVSSAEALVAVLHDRFDPTGKQRDPLVWNITRRVLNLAEDFAYDPFRDRAVTSQIKQLRAKRKGRES